MLKWPAWLGVVCEDLQAQRRYYRDTLGLRELKAEPGYVWFDFDGKLLELIAKSEEPQYDRRRVSFGFEVADIHAARAELLSRGAVPITEILGGPGAGSYWAYFEDAEHNLFELVQRLG